MIKKKYFTESASTPQWQELQSRAEAHAEKTGIPFHLWLIQSQQVIQLSAAIPPEEPTDLHHAFREELLS
jgi:hypothetical protein